MNSRVRAAASLYARGLNPKDFLYAGALAVVGLVVPLIMVRLRASPHRAEMVASFLAYY